MRKQLAVLAAIVFYMVATQTHAQQWAIRYTAITQSEGVPVSSYPVVGIHENGTVYGEYSRLRTRQPVDVPYAFSRIARFDTQSFTFNQASGVFPAFPIGDYKVFYGEEYISTSQNQTWGEMRSTLYKRSGNTYVPVDEIKVSGVVTVMHDLGGGKILIQGQFYQAQDKSGIPQVFNNCAVWDINTNTLTSIGATGIYSSHSVGSDRSLWITTQNGGFRVLHYGFVGFRTTQYQSTPFNKILRAFSLVNKDLGYGAWEVADDLSFEIVKNEGGQWYTLATLQKRSQTSTLSNAYEKMYVRDVEHLGGDTIAIIHDGTHLQGVPVSQFIWFDTKTGTFGNMRAPFLMPPHFDYGFSSLEKVGKTFWFIQRSSRDFYESWVSEMINPQILPVTLSSFAGKTVGGSHLLKWTTQSETNVSHFEIEASPDGQAFSKVGQKTALNQSGSYEVSVPAKWSQTFYRLRMVDKDGTFEYSKIITLDAPEVDLSLYPNPVVGSTLQISGLLQSTPVQIVGLDGRVFQTVTVVPSQGLDVSKLPRGVYFLRVREKTLKFVK